MNEWRCANATISLACWNALSAAVARSKLENNNSSADAFVHTSATIFAIFLIDNIRLPAIIFRILLMCEWYDACTLERCISICFGRNNIHLFVFFFLNQLNTHIDETPIKISTHIFLFRTSSKNWNKYPLKSNRTQLVAVSSTIKSVVWTWHLHHRHKWQIADSYVMKCQCSI